MSFSLLTMASDALSMPRFISMGDTPAVRYFSELEDPNSGVNALESFENLTADTDKLLGQRNKAAGKFVPTDYKAAGKKLKQQTRAKLQENKNNFDKILDKLIKEVILNK